MRLGGVTVTVNSSAGGRGAGDIAGMPSAIMAPPRLAPPAAITRPLKGVYTSSNLSLAPPTGLDGQRDGSQCAESDQGKTKEEEYESRSGSENMDGGSGEDLDTDNPPRKKRYHRHTPRQIQEMENLFKECPHPDDKQRQELSKELGLEPRQVKFWFQNRRTQMKAQQERAENSVLRAENEKLRAENIVIREAVKNASCPHCGGPNPVGDISFDEQQLRTENCRLKEELDRMSALAARYLGRPVATIPPQSYPNSTLDLAIGNVMHHTAGIELVQGPSALDLGTRPAAVSDAEKPMILDLALSSMEELLRLAQGGDPLWVQSQNGARECLNLDEYSRQFHRGHALRTFGMHTEATRESGLVMVNGANLVNMFMDASRWMEMFSCIVSKALVVDVLANGNSATRNGALQIMYAELQVMSPLVPTRDMYFLRFCKQPAEGVWAVVDVSVEGLRDNPPSCLVRCQRRPSGCVIQEASNGCCKVTLVEHLEHDNRTLHHMYRALVDSGMAYGAQRWLATLQRQCERFASLSASSIQSRDLGGVPNESGRRSMLQLAQRMTNNFCAGVSASSTHAWTTLSGSGEDDVRVMSRKSVDNPGEPHGTVLSAATSIWLPVLPQRVFNFLRDERVRSEWDILSNGGLVCEVARIAEGQDPGNSVSLLKVNPMTAGQGNMLILQESCTDVSGSLVIYAPVDIPAMQMVMQGGNPELVALLPSGFAILPDGQDGYGMTVQHEGGPVESSRLGGSLLTVAFQILVSSVPSGKLSLESVATVNNLISCTVQRIKHALRCDTC